MNRVVHRGPRWFATVLFAAGACSGGGDNGEVGPPPEPTVVGVDIAVPTGGIRVYEVVQLSATVTGSNGSVLEQPVTWVSLDGQIASITSGGRLEALAAGTARVVARSEPAADTVTIIIAPAPVASLDISPRELMLGNGIQFALSITAKDARGAVSAQPVTLTSSTSAVALVGRTIRGQQEGTATVFVQAGGVLDSVHVVVRDQLPFVLTTVGLLPGESVTLYGASLSSASVAVGSVDAAVVTLADTAVRFTVPDAPFAPCRPAGTIQLSVTRSLTVVNSIVAARSAPLVLTLEAGAHAYAPDAVARGCDVALAKPGEYLIMPYAWDRANSPSYVPSAAIAARLSVLAREGQPMASIPKLRSGPDVASSGRVGRARMEGDVLDFGTAPDGLPTVASAPYAGPVAGTSCPIPLTLGETVPIGTTRAGGIVQFAQRGAPTENWSLAAITPRLAVFFDTTMVRIAAGDATIAARLERFVAAYDSTVIPTLEAYTNGIPDGDGNGRVVLLLAYRVTGGFAYAMPNGYGRPDCTYGAAGGEAFFMPSSYVLTNPVLNLATALAFAAHETAHLVDLKGTLADRESTGWSNEGFAMQFNWLWSAGPTVTNPYSGNRASAFVRIVEGTGTGYSCVEPQRTQWAGLSNAGTGSGSYTTACAMVRAIIVRGVARGLSAREAVMRFVSLRHRYSFASATNEYDETSRSPQDIVGEWLLMWYADDYVAGTSGALQDPAMQWRSVYYTTYPLPEQTLAPGDHVEMAISEPDVHHYLTTLPAFARVRFVQPSGFTAALAARANIAFLRIR